MEHALNNFRQALHEAAAKLGLPAFWRWWTATLAPAMPAASRTAVQRRRLRPVIAFGEGVAVLWDVRVADGALTLAEVAQIPLAGDPAAVAHAGRTALEALPRRVYGGVTAGTKVYLAMPPAQVLRKQITLPAAVEENFRDALAYDLDRHTPFRPDQLYFDAVIVARDPGKREIRADWAAALRSVVDPARRHAESWGATVVGITPEALTAGTAPAPATWSKLNLLPPEERPDARPWRRPQVWLPLLLIAVLGLVAVILPIWQKRDYVIALTEITEQARVQAAASDALRQQLDRATGDYNFALGKKYAFPSTVQLLDDVTRILPDDTWLTQLEVKSMPKGKEPPHREIMLRGESGNAGRLVSALEDSKLFEQAAPRSPTTKIQPGPGEVFDLGAQLKPLPPPEPIQLVSVVPAPAAAGAASPAAPATAAAGAAPPPATPPAPPAAATPAAGAPAAAGATPGAAGRAVPAAGAEAPPAAAADAAAPAPAPAPAPRVATPQHAPGAPPGIFAPGSIAPPAGPLSPGGRQGGPRSPPILIPLPAAAPAAPAPAAAPPPSAEISSDEAPTAAQLSSAGMSPPGVVRTPAKGGVK